MNGVINKGEKVLLQAKPNMFTIGTITLPEPKIGTLVLTTKILGVDFGIEDLTFDFPHIPCEIKVDTTLVRIKVQDIKIIRWILPKDVQVQDLNIGFEKEF
jgi:hypothetical protein